LTNLLVKDMLFHFSKERHVVFTTIKEALTSAHILHPPIWGELANVWYICLCYSGCYRAI